MEITSSNKEEFAGIHRIPTFEFAVSESCVKKRQGEAFRKKDDWSPVGAVEDDVVRGRLI